MRIAVKETSYRHRIEGVDVAAAIAAILICVPYLNFELAGYGRGADTHLIVGLKPVMSDGPVLTQDPHLPVIDPYP